MDQTDSTQQALRRLTMGIVVGLVCGLGIGVFEGLISVAQHHRGLSGASEWLILVYSAVAISGVAGVFAGTVLGLIAWAAHKLDAGSKRRWALVGVCTLLFMGASTVLVKPWYWVYGRVLYTGLTVLACCFVASLWLILRFADRPWFQRVGAIGALLIFGAAYYLDIRFYFRLYDHLHNLLAFIGFCAGLAATALLLRSRVAALSRRAGWGFGLLALCTLLAAAWLPENQRVKTVLVTRTAYQVKFVNLLQSLFDFDGDGYSLVLFGRDCNDFDARINPGADEIANSGRDDNCNQVQLADQIRPYVPTPRKIDVPPNILFISIDAARADSFSFLGYRRDTTPHLARLASRSVVFSRAFSSASWTVTSLRGLLDGQYVRGHPKRDSSIQPNLIQRLNRLGYTSRLFSGKTTIVLRGDEMGRLPGINRQGVSGADGVSGLLRFISTSPPTRKLFLWLHFFEAHGRVVRSGHPDWGSTSKDHYDRSLHRADQYIGRLLAGLKRLGVDKRFLIVLFSDHGEEFGEHGGRFHGSSVYQEQIHIPLLIHYPGLTPRRISSPVSLIDLHPTLAVLYGFPFPRWRPARSLAGALIGEKFDRLGVPVFSSLNADEKYMVAAVISGRYKLILSRYYGLKELYDLDTDPRERFNLYDDRPGLAGPLLRFFQHFADNFRRPDPTHKPTPRK